ncbi:hypothetical protein [Calothrix sp. NIES-2098]
MPRFARNDIQKSGILPLNWLCDRYLSVLIADRQKLTKSITHTHD